MAWLEQDTSGYYFVCFRFGGQRFKRSLDTKVIEDAKAQQQRLDENLRLYLRGRIDIPKEADIVTFLLSDGRRDGMTALVGKLTLSKLFRLYFDSLPNDSLEVTTLRGMKIHQKNLQRHLGAFFNVRTLSKVDLQKFINKRSKDKGRRGTISPMTIKKEIVTLRSVWNWAAGTHVEGAFPSRGLKYPKATEKPQFMSFAEVEELTPGLSADDAAELWESVYLTLDDLDDLLKHVKDARLPFIYPLFVFAAHTGARRSEIVRCKRSDVDLKGGWVTLRERKRAQNKKTTRRVPISPKLHEALTKWLSNHPGGDALFCHNQYVERSKKRSRTTGHKAKDRRTTISGRLFTVTIRAEQPAGPLTRNEIQDHFKRALANSKWAKLKGLHTLRHSFISCLASSGCDQRLIDEFSGHTTEEQRRRYRHLFPNVTRQAIEAVFG